MFPKETVWWATGYDNERASVGEKSSSTPRIIPACFKLRHDEHTSLGTMYLLCRAHAVRTVSVLLAECSRTS